jgi:hypothetical protein
MLAGYALVGGLVADGIDLFALGNSRHLLELNNVVLCGTSAVRRTAYARHIAATEHEPRDRSDLRLRRAPSSTSYGPFSTVGSRASG